MSTTQPARPFLGPRPFQAGETLYGRDYEARALLSMLVAERVVLLHSPSGAGKTSLIQAALIPLLEQRGFTVLPTVRVGQEPPPGWAGNRYARAMLLALEEGRPPDEQLPLAALEALSLSDYLARRVPAEADQDAVLIIDQFEELLTRDPTDHPAKRAFFRALGDMLRAPRLWALVVMREEYVAALEPYIPYIPNRLDAHFPLNLLGVKGALAALREPPRRLGVDFPAELAARLVDDLRRVNVQQADGTILQQLGPSVEPVQLQVVGLRIWERLPAGATAIRSADLDAIGDVGRALGDYYAERVAAVAAATGAGERAVRGWFARELITPQGVRGQVLQGAGASAGLANAAITQLVDAYLVRAEPRRGATWYELAHDRLIAPVRASNAAWFAANLRDRK
ncbi:MAG: ATP-binding protein, partial [Oscillochloris sp.]|nr:ATP-binding protein [Oscillochloris sp.]